MFDEVDVIVLLSPMESLEFSSLQCQPLKSRPNDAIP